MTTNEDVADSGSSSSSPPSSPPLLPIPDLDYRWVHAGAQHLDLLPTPVTSAATAYKAFSPDESERIEERWESMEDEERRQAVREWGASEGEGAPKPKPPPAPKTDKTTKPRSSSLSNKEREERKEGKVPEKEEIMSGQEQAVPEEQDKVTAKYKEFMANITKDYDKLETVVGVPVSQDSLFEVSLPTLSLHPVFWLHTGSRVSVMRGTWFVGDMTKPCSWDLAEEIEKAYKEIRPWQPSYKHELATAVSIGASAEDKLKYLLPARFGQGLGIMFDDAEKGRLIGIGPMSFLPRSILSGLRTRAATTYIYRGYRAACAASGKAQEETGSGKRSGTASRRGSSSSLRSNAAMPKESAHHRSASRSSAIVEDAIKLVRQQDKELLGVEQALRGIKDDVEKKLDGGSAVDEALDEESIPIVDSNDDDAPCTDLILVIHGIGQQLATQYESYSFVYAGNQLRQVMRKQSNNPALQSIIRDRRCQVLPVQWRASLDLEEEKTQEDREHGMDNQFTMADITINKSIPYVRELTNSVLLDIPLFMSHHRQKMIEAVCTQANKLYRLWVARHPDFEKTGRVHIIGHSLGSALAAHILSDQPTKMPPLSQLPKQVITKTRDRFLFNTSNLFLCGSPLGIFLHLDQTQLMPRKGRERTMHSPQDEAIDRSGKFGCMAVDSLYNIFYFTDPIAYQLNAAVDVRLAAKRPPLAITSVTAPFYASVSEGMSSISRYLPVALGGGGSPAKKIRPGAIRLPSGIEMSGNAGEERLEGARGERRFSALNPHGNLDFYLPSAGVSEYLDMITAHASYWSDPSFAAFLLAEIFSTKWDLIRTGMGLAHQQLPEGTII